VELVQEIGSYAGFAAVLGLAVLSALYFSQARDVRRLREWAGRAPERSAEHDARVRAEAAAEDRARVAPAAQKAAAGAEVQPAAKPATAGAPAAAQAGPGGPAPATAAASAGAASGTAAPSEQSGDKEEAAKEGREKAPAVAAATGAGAARAAAGRTTAPARPGAPAARRPAAAGTGNDRARTVGTLPRQPPRVPSSTAVLRASERKARWYRRMDWRYAMLVVTGILIVGGGAAFGASKLLEEEDSPVATEQPAPEARERQRRAPVDPTQVTVSVLNGTTVPGLAAAVGDKVEAARFQLGNVTNATENQRAESVAMFKPGANREARAVARKLGISQIEPVDPRSAALSGNATVVVVVGADQTE
jgi:hypothetical protein